MRPERQPPGGQGPDSTSDALAELSHRSIRSWAQTKKRGMPAGPAARVCETRLLLPAISASTATTATAPPIAAPATTAAESATAATSAAARTARGARLVHPDAPAFQISVV